MYKGKISAKEKITAVYLYLDGKGSQQQIAVSYGMILGIDITGKCGNINI